METTNFPAGWDDATSRFFRVLFDAVSGDAAAKVSMFEIGEKLGLDRGDATRAAERIMAEGWAEVRTLAGDIGLTPAGVEAYRALGAEEGAGAAGGAVSGLGAGALLEADARRSVELVVAELRLQLQKGGFSFDALTELIADLRTIDAQLASSRPKTAILRACFKSILGLISSSGRAEMMGPIKQLLA